MSLAVPGGPRTPGGLALPGGDKAGLLLRKSKLVKEGINAVSIEAQYMRGMEWAGSTGLTVDPAHVYRENVSGYKDVNREGFDAALASMERGEFGTLWCFALDRLSRRGAIIVASVLGRGGRFIFDWERLDSADPRDLRMILWRAEDAKEYSDRLSENVRNTKRIQRETGAYVGHAPWGMRIADPVAARKLARAEEWPGVEQAHELAANNMGTRRVAAQLNESGWRTRRGNLFRGATVRKMILNPAYEGLQVVTGANWDPVAYRDEEGNTVYCMAPGEEPLDPELVRAARAALRRGGYSFRYAALPKPGEAKHLLTGTATCTGCTGPMHAGGGASERGSYQCSRHDSVAGSCPRPANITALKVEPYAVQEFMNRVTALDPADPDDQPAMIAIADAWTATQDPETTAEAEEALRAAKDAEKLLARLMADREAGFYDGPLWDRFTQRHADLKAAHAAAISNYEGLTGRAGRLDITWITDAETLAEVWGRSTADERRNIFMAAVARVEIDKATKRGHQGDISSRINVVMRWDAAEDDDAPPPDGG